MALIAREVSSTLKLDTTLASETNAREGATNGASSVNVRLSPILKLVDLLITSPSESLIVLVTVIVIWSSPI